MRSFDQLFIDQIRAQREVVRSRRSLLGQGGRLAAAGAIGVATGGFGMGRWAAPALAQDFTDDLDVLNYALTLEHLENAFYRDGLAMFGKDEVADATGSTFAFDWLTAIGEHEAAHVDALSATITSLDGVPVEEASYDFGVTDLPSFLETAAALETTGVAAYAGAAPSIENQDVLAAALGIHSVEARHAAYINTLLEMTPFPEAVDVAKSREDVLKAAGGFIVSGATATPATPEASGAGAGGGTTVEVRIVGYKFVPADVSIPVGGSVTWINDDIVPHTATAEDGSFDSETMDKGVKFTQTFDTAGSVPYLCEIHTSMKGTVEVTE